jgi:hypothetical protein
VPPLVSRKAGEQKEIAEFALLSSVWPSSNFTSKYGCIPWETFEIVDFVQRGFQNALEARPMVPSASSNSFFAFRSVEIELEIGQLFSFFLERISMLDAQLESSEFKAERIAPERFFALKNEPG